MHVFQTLVNIVLDFFHASPATAICICSANLIAIAICSKFCSEEPPKNFSEFCATVVVFGLLLFFGFVPVVIIPVILICEDIYEQHFKYNERFDNLKRKALSYLSTRRTKKLLRDFNALEGVDNATLAILRIEKRRVDRQESLDESKDSRYYDGYPHW